MYQPSKHSIRVIAILFLINVNHNLLCHSSKKLVAALKAIVKKSDCHTGVAIYSFKKNNYIYTKNAGQSFMPASNAKLFIGLAILDTLGKKYCFETSLLTHGLLDNNTLKGDVYLKGAGDPSLTAHNVEQLLQNLAHKKIQKIEGNFYIDRDIFDTIAFAPGTSVDNIGESWHNPVGGLIIDHKAVTVTSFPEAEFLNSSHNPAVYFDANTFIQNIFKRNTIAFSGTVTFKKAPANCSLLATHKSLPLIQLVTKCMKQSDNLYADCLFKKLGAHIHNAQGSWANGSDALKTFLQTKLAISPDTIRIMDGSGLSRYNLVSPTHLATLLIWVYTQPLSHNFLKTLPISGIDGTLIKRMNDIPSKVKAKTGTMGGISALSGYLTTDDDTLAFVIINNGYISESMYAPACKKEIEDAVCRLLVEWKK